jgi:hypothetical protein
MDVFGVFVEKGEEKQKHEDRKIDKIYNGICMISIECFLSFDEYDSLA